MAGELNKIEIFRILHGTEDNIVMEQDNEERRKCPMHESTYKFIEDVNDEMKKKVPWLTFALIIAICMSVVGVVGSLAITASQEVTVLKASVLKKEDIDKLEASINKIDERLYRHQMKTESKDRGE